MYNQARIIWEVFVADDNSNTFSTSRYFIYLLLFIDSILIFLLLSHKNPHKFSKDILAQDSW